jgi:hypothetical protein
LLSGWLLLKPRKITQNSLKTLFSLIHGTNIPFCLDSQICVLTYSVKVVLFGQSGAVFDPFWGKRDLPINLFYRISNWQNGFYGQERSYGHGQEIMIVVSVVVVMGVAGGCSNPKVDDASPVDAEERQTATQGVWRRKPVSGCGGAGGAARTHIKRSEELIAITQCQQQANAATTNELTCSNRGSVSLPVAG